MFLYFTLHYRFVPIKLIINSKPNLLLHSLKSPFLLSKFTLFDSTFPGRKNEDRAENFASQSVAAVIMMVFQYSSNPGKQKNKNFNYKIHF